MTIEGGVRAFARRVDGLVALLACASYGSVGF
jgi:hypothetical protein